MPEVLGPSRTSRKYHRWRYRLLLLYTANQRKQLLHTLDKHPAWLHLLNTDLGNYYVFFRRYLDRRISIRQRFHAMITDLEVAARAFGPVTSQRLAHGHSVRLCQTEQLSIDLTINEPTRIEGFWALTLNTADGQPLFNLSFGFTGPHSVLIASIQGLKRDDGANRDVIRSLTKHCHGLRPHALLLEVFKMVCANWPITHLEGIDPKRQVTLYKKGSDEFRFDYRSYWQECGAHQMPCGNWRIPAEIRRRSHEDIPPHKRAMYRKRAAMLETMAAGIPQALDDPRGHPGAPNCLTRLDA